MGTKRTTFAERQARTAPASAKRRKTIADDIPDQHEDVEITDDDKENDEKLAREKERGDHFKGERDKSEKRAKYWQRQAEKGRTVIKELKRENKVMGKEILEKDGELMRQRSCLEEVKDKNRQQRESISGYQQKLHAVNQKITRIPHRLKTVFGRAVRVFSKKKTPGDFHTKEKGVIRDETRDIMNDLVALDGVASKNVFRVFTRVAGALGVKVEGTVNERSVRRIIKEGGNASKLQFVDAVSKAKGVTLSGDGTTHKNETYETKFATVNDGADTRLQFFLGIKTAINHTSETQLDGWIELVEEMYHLAFESGLVSREDASEFWKAVTGFHSDHAEDQKKLFRLLKEWKQAVDRDIRGVNAERTMNQLEHASFVLKCSLQAVDQVGGPEIWDMLTFEQRNTKIDEARRQLIRELGEEEFQKLPETEKKEIDFFLWAGCCMHKEMNAFKGGCVGLEKFWEARRGSLEAPVKMYNRDNSATVELAPGTAASQRAQEITKGGAVKVASLCGSIFRHKDRKRGQQDTIRFFFDHELGFVITFPDTSNTRFQSHAEACAVLITHLDLFIKFLTYVKENKDSRKWNHMEQNVWNGLHCNATRHEICVITLYWLAISVPYMREIRGPFREHDNILHLGALHERVLAHIDTLIREPWRLIGPDASAALGSLDGKEWERPQAFYAVQYHSKDLPHLQELLVYFLVETRVYWVRFSFELTNPEGPIALATPSQKKRAYMESSNDQCEGSFAHLRQTARRNPTMSVVQYNSRQMYKFNRTHEYIRTLSPEMRAFLRRISRQQDESGANRESKLALARHKQQVALNKAEKDRLAAEEKQAAIDELKRVSPILTSGELDFRLQEPRSSELYLSVAKLDMQLKWQRMFGVKGVVGGSIDSWGKREAKIDLLRAAIAQCNKQGITAKNYLQQLEEEEEESDVEITVEDLEAYDSEKDYFER